MRHLFSSPLQLDEDNKNWPFQIFNVQLFMPNPEIGHRARSVTV